MKIERVIKSFRYSLHDTRVKKIGFEDGNLVFYLDNIYLEEEEEKISTKKAKISFEYTEDINFLIINDTLGERFKGKYLDIEAFTENYSKSEFEILSEAYDHDRAVFQGWLWSNAKKPSVCILNVYFLGEMIYEIESK